MLHARIDYNMRIQDNQNLIPDNEPVFLLRGQDRFAPILLDIYAALTEASPQGSIDIIEATKKHAEAMRVWQEIECKKFADMDIQESIY